MKEGVCRRLFIHEHTTGSPYYRCVRRGETRKPWKQRECCGEGSALARKKLVVAWQRDRDAQQRPWRTRKTKKKKKKRRRRRRRGRSRR
jgi:hypothetical protein